MHHSPLGGQCQLLRAGRDLPQAWHRHRGQRLKWWRRARGALDAGARQLGHSRCCSCRATRLALKLTPLVQLPVCRPTRSSLRNRCGVDPEPCLPMCIFVGSLSHPPRGQCSGIQSSSVAGRCPSLTCRGAMRVAALPPPPGARSSLQPSSSPNTCGGRSLTTSPPCCIMCTAVSGHVLEHAACG